MKAYVIERTGGPEVLTLRDIDSVKPQANEVRIRVRAFGLNKAEAYLRTGKMGPIDAPRVPGIEAVGEVIEDPAGVFHPGQRVATLMGGMQFDRHGSYAEEVTVLRSNVIDLDDAPLSWAELAALPQAFLTAWGALDHSLHIQAGQTLLIRGATSTVGLAATSYAQHAGLTVIATTRRTEHTAALRQAGASEVVIDDGNIGAQLKSRYGQGIDAALEIVGASTLPDTASALRPFGHLTTIDLLGGAPILNQFNLMSDLPPAVSVNFFPSQLFGTPALPLTASPLARIAGDIAKGKMHKLATRVCSFDDVPQAHQWLDNAREPSKIVVVL
ncbi:zinc-binding dehydrogenase [Klebsiella sp. WP4-W18-ESBL-05]|uniref:zinc-binding dehydrogenase n=1 Tax=Klebsiella sp. WP4-W18-ESBL-05 TaxID=2675713 RepID=UPI0015DC6842|nr:zinc-binding dehydrogenase [Klebsiella sp. WP4-W18-ESBL-05]BBR59715.1 alcohol dehydrogenase [Klebsiella sp. WP4-W18-ESBL-05]